MVTSSVLWDYSRGRWEYGVTSQELLARTPPELAVQFHVLSFEGPDDYARAGGIASRITGLTQALADTGFETHLWFIGDPNLPGHESRGQLRLHRWCQWISHYHPGGVYDGEEGKRADYASSLPPFVLHESLLPHLRKAGGRAVILAEEWQTVDAVLHLDSLLRLAGVRERVALFWNANNTFGFDRIPWSRLSEAAVITTVSRYMRQGMWGLGVDALVVPNGLSAEAFRAPERGAVREFRQRVHGRLVLTKVARWDPDKRWLLAIDTVGELKRRGWRPLLVARGGVEEHGAEVLARARGIGLRVAERSLSRPGVQGLIGGLKDLNHVDVLSIRSQLCSEACRVLFRGAGAVLANSGHEPFGLVGLEAMAAGGLACTGSTGEDYAVPGWNALVLQTNDPCEFVRHFHRLRRSPTEERAVRRRGAATAKRYTWPEIIRRNLIPHCHLVNDPPPWVRAVRAEQEPPVFGRSPESHERPDVGARNGSNGHGGIYHSPGREALDTMVKHRPVARQYSPVIPPPSSRWEPAG